MAYKTIIEAISTSWSQVPAWVLPACDFEARYWGNDKKIVDIAEKANMTRFRRRGAGLYAINCYMGTRFGGEQPGRPRPLCAYRPDGHGA